MSTIIGSISAFDSKTCRFNTYVSRLRAFFAVNKIKLENQVNVFITVMGDEMFELLINLASPADPTSKTFVELVAILANHYEPACLEVAERQHFLARRQKESEPISSFVADLKRLALTCNYGDHLSAALRDQLVSGLRNDSVKRKLLTEPQLTFEKAINIAQQLEVANKKLISLQNISSSSTFVNKYMTIDTTSLVRNKTFHAISLDLLLTENKSTKIIKEIELLRKLMITGIESGVVTPLPVTLFNCDEAENALRFIFSGKHIGKVVIKLRDECEETLGLPQIFAANIFPNRKSYIITGGLGGIGLELMYWMYERGARNFVLTSRYGVKTNGQQFAINRLRNLNCNIVVRTDNASNINGAKVIIEKSQELGPIAGIFLLSVELDDNLFENQTENSFKTMFDSKSNQAIIFDKLLRQLSQPIDYFVCFSSVVSGRGFIGQSNYGMANSILERVCEQRQRNGLNATAIQFGLIKEVGIVTSDDYADIDLELRTGYRKQTIISMLSAIEPFIASSHAVCSSMIVNDMMRKTDAKTTALQELASILDISDSIHSIDPNTKLSELGVDSLVATEYGNVLLRKFNTNISFRDLRNLTIHKIKQIK